MRRPFNGQVVISQEYGVRDSVYRKGYHTGVDYALPSGHELVSPTNGTVLESGSDSSRGNFIIIRGADGVTHHLYHMRGRAVVSSGEVAEGQHVGYVGSTGMSSGPHLHWETRRNDVDFAPGSWLFSQGPFVPDAPKPKTYCVRVFGDFRTLYSSPGVRTSQQIRPNQFGGSLDYVVLAQSGVYVKIRTQMYGERWIYCGADVANLTQYYWA